MSMLEVEANHPFFGMKTEEHFPPQIVRYAMDMHGFDEGATYMELSKAVLKAGLLPYKIEGKRVIIAALRDDGIAGFTFGGYAPSLEKVSKAEFERLLAELATQFGQQ